LRGRAIKSLRRLDGYDFEFDVEYDNANRVTSATYPDGSIIAYTYDQASRLTSIHAAHLGIELVPSMQYDGRGLLSEARYGDGSILEWQYDALMRRAQMGSSSPDGELFQGWDYIRDRNGNLESITDRESGPISSSGRFTYDAGYRLIEAHWNPDSSDAEQVNYELDKLDNITRMTSSKQDHSISNLGQFHYDSIAPGAVTQVGDLMMGYDAAGHMTERGSHRYQWDFMGRMTSATDGEQPIAQFTYGPNQSRIAKNDRFGYMLYPSKTFEIRDGISTLYIKMQGHRMARIENDSLATQLLDDVSGDERIGVVDAWMLRHEDSNRLLQTSVRRLLMETGPDDGTTYLHHNHMGSITTATGLKNTEHRVIGARSFDAAGAVQNSVGYTDEYGFTGQELDQSTGLIHFDWRYMDPMIGRWLSIDPSFKVLSPDNLMRPGEQTAPYTYVANNSINYIDSHGLDVTVLEDKSSSHVSEITINQTPITLVESTIKYTQSGSQKINTFMHYTVIIHDDVEMSTTTDISIKLAELTGVPPSRINALTFNTLQNAINKKGKSFKFFSGKEVWKANALMQKSKLKDALKNEEHAKTLTAVVKMDDFASAFGLIEFFNSDSMKRVSKKQKTKQKNKSKSNKNKKSNQTATKSQ
ncbi:MAG: RHS repeat-associated core domain-containing protein, partial [Myxococcota bacterium]